MTLLNVESISGYGDSVIYLKDGGKLNLERDVDSAAIKEGIIRNIEPDKYAIGQEVVWSSTMLDAIKWNDKKLQILTQSDNVSYCIQGTIANNGSVFNNSIALPEEYELQWSDFALSLKAASGQ